MPVERFRRLPVEFEMLEWAGTNADEVTAWVHANGGRSSIDGGVLSIWAEHEQQWIRVPVGHRIVRGSCKEFYPISPEALAASYEQVA